MRDENGINLEFGQKVMEKVEEQMNKNLCLLVRVLLQKNQSKSAKRKNWKNKNENNKNKNNMHNKIHTKIIYQDYFHCLDIYG